ncbi:hypothetical protein MXB_2863 [Myxobolus squamalis]|nr:hypothetical protein MXB_2863 [Myxobolus squamalis]
MVQRPADRQSIIVPEAYTTYKSSPSELEQFLLWDSGRGDNDRILFFGRESNTSSSNQMIKLYADGTFVLYLPLFAQIYILIAERGGFVLPILYVLFSNKDSATYNRMFVAIRTLWPNFRPVSFSIDFKQAAVSAARSTFSDISIHGFLFYLTKNMRKKLSDEGLFCRYNTTPNFELAARMIVAIAFVPSHRIDSALEMLLVELPDDLKVVLNWLEGSYVSCLVCGVRCGALFPFHMWSVYECTLRSLDHTNNHAEVAHCQIRAEFGMEHLTL